MRDRRSNLLGLLSGLLALIAALLLLPATSTAADPDDVEGTRLDPDGVRAYWTSARMEAAIPVEEPVASLADRLDGRGEPRGKPSFVEPLTQGSSEQGVLQSGLLEAQPETRAEPLNRDEITNPSDPAFRMHGKVFFTIPSGASAGDYVCSATSVNSPDRNLVLSAGHCAHAGVFASNWLFVPAYKNGDAPFGEWPATELATTEQWKSSENLKFDISMATVAPNGQGKELADVVGARGIAFNQPREQNYESFGYPAESPPFEFTGGREFRCTSKLDGTDNPGGDGPNTNRIACDMTGGSSGGGWVAGSTLLGVNSYSYCAVLISCEQTLYSPYFSNDAQNLYESLAGKLQTCKGEPVTHLGTSGDDVLKGTNGPDVFKAKGGNDEIKAKDGNDLVCAGAGKDKVKGQNGKDELYGDNGKDKLVGGDGKDKLKGGDGKDTLKGGDGKDKLVGNAGKDKCVGNGGKDKAKSCEKEKSI